VGSGLQGIGERPGRSTAGGGSFRFIAGVGQGQAVVDQITNQNAVDLQEFHLIGR
jgi:hypothetical protein